MKLSWPDPTLRVTIETRYDPGGAIMHRKFACLCTTCDTTIYTKRRWRMVWHCRMHRFLCRGYRFPGTLEDLA